MKIYWKFLLVYMIASPASAQISALRCSEAHRGLQMRESLGLFQTASRHRLGIGVFAQAQDGDFILGISPYSGSFHQGVVARMNKHQPLLKVLWMGELRYDTHGPYPQIVEANETSGYFQEIKGEPQVFQVENDVRNLPPVLLKKYFDGKRFETSGESRLAPELRHVDGNIRHGINNSIQVMRSLLSLLHRPSLPLETKIDLLSSVASGQSGDVQLVRWMMIDLLLERRLRLQEVAEALAFVDAVMKPNFSKSHIATLTTMSREVIDQQLLVLSQFNQGDERLVPVTLWQVKE